MTAFTDSQSRTERRGRFVAGSSRQRRQMRRSTADIALCRAIFRIQDTAPP